MKNLNRGDYAINLEGLIISQTSTMADVVSQVSAIVESAIELQGVSDTCQLNELGLVACMHVLNSMGVEYFNSDNDDLFGMDILYQQGFSALGGTPQFNGSISGVKWQVDGNNPGYQGYGFKYDDWYQLTEAKYARQGAPHTWDQ
ncbi:MAG: hypothetical protein R2764_23055 [Bacteroidales bacterium]